MNEVISELGATLSLVAGAILQDSVTCVLAGVLVSQGQISFQAAFVGCFLGTLIGDVVLLTIGRMMGWTLLDRWLHRLGTDGDRVARWRQWIERHSVAAVFISRFTPLLQTPLHLVNGFLCRRQLRLAPALVVAAAVYVLLFLTVVRSVADFTQEAGLGEHSWAWMAGIGIGVWILFQIVSRSIFALVRRFQDPVPAIGPNPEPITAGTVEATQQSDE